MKVNYCPECGTKILKGDAFCSECGVKIIPEEEIVQIAINHCTSCDYSTREDDKFCPECGARMSQSIDEIGISDDTSFKSSKELMHSIQTNKETLKTKTQPIQKPKRKKRTKGAQIALGKSKVKQKGGFLRFVGKLVLGLIILMIVGSIVLYNLEKNEWEENQWVENQKKENQQEEDYNEVPTSKKTEKTAVIHDPKTPARPKLNESKSIEQVANQVEQIFQNADTIALKGILTETSLKAYDGVFSSIEPYMQDYAKAFEARKLEVETNMYSLYSFKDKNGKRFTVEFAQIDKGVWRLVRF